MKKVFSKVPALWLAVVFVLSVSFFLGTGAGAQEEAEIEQNGKLEVTDEQVEMVLEKIIGEKLDRIIERRLEESNEELESNDDKIDRLESELEEGLGEQEEDGPLVENDELEMKSEDELEGEADKKEVNDINELDDDESGFEIGGVIITELLPDPIGSDSGNEWIELYNNTDEEIYLKGWTMKDNSKTAHKTAHKFSEEFSIPPKEYRIFTPKFRLNNGGEEKVELFDPADNLISQVIYQNAPENQSYARKADGTYQWTDTVTPGAENEFSSSGSNEDGNEDGDEEDDEDDEEDDEEAGEQKPGFQAEDISITELLPNPIGSDSGNEWIELYNNTDEEIYLKGWTMKDTSKTVYKFSEQFSIPAQEYRIFLPKFSLNNSGEEKVKLFDPADNLISQTTYRDAPENQSWAKMEEGRFAWTEILTPEEANEFSKQKSDETNNEKPTGDFPPLILNEIFSNPTGADGDREWLEIFNPQQERIDLSGWSLENSGGKTLALEGVIESGQFLFIKLKKQNHFSLRNSDEEIILKNPKGEKSDQVMLEGNAPTAQSFSRQQSGGWQWTKYLTPGERNKFNRRPKIKVKIPKAIYPGQYFELDASGTKDKDGDKLKFVWEWDDGKKSHQRKIRKKFEEVGKYKLVLKVSDGTETVKKKLKIKVEKYPPTKVVIVGLKPNPRGIDFRHEFIEIENRSGREVDLQNWKLATAGKSAGNPTAKKITREIKLEPTRRRKIFNDEDCRFSLSNTGGLVELRYPDGELADLVEYNKDKIKEGEEYLQRAGQWRWVSGDGENGQAEGENSDAGRSGNSRLEESDSASVQWRWWKVTWNEKARWCESLQGLSYGNWLNKNRPYFNAAGWHFRQVD